MKQLIGFGEYFWFCNDGILNRDKANLDIFWIRDESLEDSDNLSDPAVFAGKSSSLDSLRSGRPRARADAKLGTASRGRRSRSCVERLRKIAADFGAVRTEGAT